MIWLHQTDRRMSRWVIFIGTVQRTLAHRVCPKHLPSLLALKGWWCCIASLSNKVFTHQRAIKVGAVVQSHCTFENDSFYMHVLLNTDPIKHNRDWLIFDFFFFFLPVFMWLWQRGHKEQWAGRLLSLSPSSSWISEREKLESCWGILWTLRKLSSTLRWLSSSSPFYINHNGDTCGAWGLRRSGHNLLRCRPWRLLGSSKWLQRSPGTGAEHGAHHHACYDHVLHGLHCGGHEAVGPHQETVGHLHRLPLPVRHHAFHSLRLVAGLQRAACAGYRDRHYGLLSWRHRLQHHLLLAGWRHGPEVRNQLVNCVV